MRWKRHDGALDPVRCGASNRCDYCAMFSALETSLVLKLDAQMQQPTVGITTTTRRADFPIAELREAEALLWRALRKGRRIGARGRRRKDEASFDAFPDLQYCGFLEWTTGKGTRSGGHRRPHIHHLVKGIPADHPLLDEKVLDDGSTTTALEQRVAELWHAITGDAYIVESRRLRTPAGAIAYLSLHHHKRLQAAPPGFKGRRLRVSKGYFLLPRSELRELAQRLAADDRVKIAAKKTIRYELIDDPPAEYVADDDLTSALVAALRDMAEHPGQAQVNLFTGTVPFESEIEELEARVKQEIVRIRERPSELVRVREVTSIDQATGLLVPRATAILGPPEPRMKRAA